jgi:hypothetical protein
MRGTTDEIKEPIMEAAGVNTAVVGVYSSHIEAEASVKELQRWARTITPRRRSRPTSSS